jgi:hypothetical protein
MPVHEMQAAEQSDDFRLNVAFMRACMDDKAQVGAALILAERAGRARPASVARCHVAGSTRLAWDLGV